MKLPSWPDPAANPLFFQKLSIDGSERLLNIRKALDVLGNPQRDLQNVIHVAGTNGKGSTSRAIHHILLESGLKSNLYTSPHLSRYNERFVINDKEASDLDINEAIESVRQAVEGKMEVNFFDVTFMAMTLIFSKYPADFNIVEVGLGGMFDSTNVVENKIMSIIAPISFDHEETLGYSLESISQNKAKIIRQKDVVFAAGQKEIPMKEIKREAANMGASLFFESKDWSTKMLRRTPKHFDFISRNKYFYNIRNISTNYLAREQCQNASLAISACQYIGRSHPSVDEGAMRAGIRNFKHECRFELLNLKNYPHATILIDGAHNDDGVKALFKYLNESCAKYAKNIGVMCVLEKKNIKRIAASIKGLDLLFLVLPDELRNFHFKRFYEPKDLERELTNLVRVPMVTSEGVEGVISRLDKNRKIRITFFGSLFFAKVAKERILAMEDGNK